jgi:3'-phosphoadenosine 5'-phosphosulfate sulfotransferase (PAPS reductase)/FAD synthetase
MSSPEPHPLLAHLREHYSAQRLAHVNRVVVWFSCGVTSAVTAALATVTYGRVFPLVIAYCDTASEHPDNQRFLRDVQEWVGQKIHILKSDRYEDTWDVWEKTRWLVGPKGARCTVELKKSLRHEFQDVAGDLQLFGFDASEADRAARFRENNPEVCLGTPLITRNLQKEDCLAFLQKAEVDRPAIYNLGYRNANCIPCVKGQQGYWNKIRKDFPEQFARMAALERKLDVAVNKRYVKGKRLRLFLDELDPAAGRYAAEPDISCGLGCGAAIEEVYSEECEL